MPHSVEQEEPSDRIHVSLLGVDAVVVVQPPDDAADLIEQPGLAPQSGPDPHVCPCPVPYGGARAALHNPLPRQGLSRLADAPAAI
jgi:hypothetical protein